MYTLSIAIDDNGRLDVAATSVGPSVSLTIVRNGICTGTARIGDPETATALLQILSKVMAYVGWDSSAE